MPNLALPHSIGHLSPSGFPVVRFPSRETTCDIHCRWSQSVLTQLDGLGFACSKIFRWSVSRGNHYGDGRWFAGPKKGRTQEFTVYFSHSRLQIWPHVTNSILQAYPSFCAKSQSENPNPPDAIGFQGAHPLPQPKNLSHGRKKNLTDLHGSFWTNANRTQVVSFPRQSQQGKLAKRKLLTIQNIFVGIFLPCWGVEV